MPVCVDKSLVGRRFRRSLETYDRTAVVQKRMADDLIARIGEHSPPFRGGGRVLEIGCGTGLLTRLLVERLRPEVLFVNDLVADCAALVDGMAERHNGRSMSFLPGDIETANIPPRLDIVAANAVFHWLDDLETLLERIADALVPGGILAFTTFGPGNMEEVSSITGVSLNYLEIDIIEEFLSRRFRILYRREKKTTLEFVSVREVLRHLRRTGANGLRPGTWPPRRLRNFEEDYAREHSRGGIVPLTYHPITFVAGIES
jgi:malonyl-CoA O-methyltransferase